MADCHDLFQTYLNAISLSETKLASLKTSREANRKRIRTHFRDVLKRDIPRFRSQGSFVMDTAVTPLKGDFDIDDGVYLQGLGTDPNEWPASKTVHGWLVDATKGHTDMPPQDRARCVRVRYKPDYHVDLPSYAMNGDNPPKPQIFDNDKPDTYESDPLGMIEWFDSRVAATSKRLPFLIRYLKGWRDYQNDQRSGAVVASGLGLTILCCNNISINDRDDIALVETAEAMYADFSRNNRIKKPVLQFEDLAADWNDDNRRSFRMRLDNLGKRGREALGKDKPEAARIWCELFGDRFPLADSDGGDSGSDGSGKPPGTAQKTEAPAILHTGWERSA